VTGIVEFPELTSDCGGTFGKGNPAFEKEFK